MTSVAVLTARMASNRYPRKIMCDIQGKPMIYWIVEMLLKAKKLDTIVLATTTESGDSELAAWCKDNSIDCFRGANDDVLLRVKLAGEYARADKVLRVTGDSPFISYELIDLLIDSLDSDHDYANNCYGPSPWLDGVNAEIAWADAVSRAHRMTPYGQGHQVHPRIPVDGTWRSHCFHWMATSSLFRQRWIDTDCDISDIFHIPLMVDEPKDLAVANLVMEEVLKAGDDSYARLLEIVRQKKSAIEALRAG